MSYDVIVYSIHPFAAPETLPRSDLWRRTQGGASFEGRGFLVNLGAPDAVLPEDVPDAVLPLLPGIAYQHVLSLEPIHAPEAGARLLRAAAVAVAKASRGAIFDPQEDSVALPKGVKRWLPQKHGRDERAPILTLSWWFTHARILEREALSRLLTVIEAHLPEAMPRRYGLYEPPQHRYEETGRDHLVSFLADHLTETVVWYAQRPVAYVHCSVDTVCGWRRIGGKAAYRCNRLSLDLDAAVLDQPGWPAGLARAFHALSRELRPFFGDVRRLEGYFLSGGRIASDGRSEPHPVKSWWWHGLPPRLGLAAVVGPPYLALWPALAAQADVVDGLAFLDGGDWVRGGDAADRIGGVPPRLALPFMPHVAASAYGGLQVVYPEEYPEVFPFGRPDAVLPSPR